MFSNMISSSAQRIILRLCVRILTTATTAVVFLSCASYPEPEKELKDRFRILVDQGQVYLKKDEYDSAYLRLNQSLKIWNDYGEDILVKNESDKIPVYMMYNGLGIYFINKEMDYEKATEFLVKGLSLASKWYSRQEYAVMAQNLVFTFFLRQNPDGLKYALDVYSKSKRLNNARMAFIGAYGCAMMYYVREDYSSALRFIKEAVSSPYIQLEQAGVYNMYANILQALGDNIESEENYRKAMVHIDSAQVTTATYVYLSFGNWLLSQHRYREGTELLKTGLHLADKNCNKVFTWQICRALSQSYAASQCWKEAYSYQTRYHSEADSVFNIDKERTINKLEAKYIEAQHEAAMHKKNKALIMLCMLCALILAISIGLTIMHHNKERMYTKIVRQYKSAVDKEAEFEKIMRRNTELEKELNLSAKNVKSQNPVEYDRSGELFRKLEHLMKEDKIYRDPNLSRDRLADILNTNRTYISAVINGMCKKSVTQYINDYRIDHAIKLLSNPVLDMQIKEVEYNSGFNADATFFKLFKEKVGMSPSKYRQKVKETLHKTN